MRFRYFIASLTVWGTTALAETTAEERCGILGVMAANPANLPIGVDPHSVRECVDHPIRLSASAMQKRDCWQGDAVGCSPQGYCYQRCGLGEDYDNGFWCWTALNGGFGNWTTCRDNDDCKLFSTSLNVGCGSADSDPSCTVCGCSC